RVAHQEDAVGLAEVVPAGGPAAAVVGEDEFLQPAVGPADVGVDVEGAADGVGDDRRVADQANAVGLAEVVPVGGPAAAVVGEDEFLQPAVGPAGVGVDVRNAAEVVGGHGRATGERQEVAALQ